MEVPHERLDTTLQQLRLIRNAPSDQVFLSLLDGDDIDAVEYHPIFSIMCCEMFSCSLFWQELELKEHLVAASKVPKQQLSGGHPSGFVQDFASQRAERESMLAVIESETSRMKTIPPGLSSPIGTQNSG